MNKESEYSKLGKAFLKAIKKLVEDTHTNDKRALFETLDQINLKEGFCLGLHLPCQVGIGDESWFYTYPEFENSYKDMPDFFKKSNSWIDKINIFEDLEVNASAMGAWQAYLYSIAPTVMPVFWHGGYISRDFIFSMTDLDDIAQKTRIKDLLESVKELEIMPSVFFENNKATVSCCYWTDWGGLIRETVNIEFSENKNITLAERERKSYYEYDCGILF